MTWFAFSGKNNGKAVNLAGVQEKEAVFYGFHGYATELQAEAHPNSTNPLNGWVASLMIADYHAAVAGGQQPGGPNANVLNPINDAKAAAKQAASQIPGLGQVGDFFHRLTEGSTWVRVGEVVAGLLLVYVGVKAVTTPGGASVASRGVKQTAISVGKKVPGVTRVAVKKAGEADLRRRERAAGVRAVHRRTGPAPEGRSAPYVIPRGRHAGTGESGRAVRA